MAWFGKSEEELKKWQDQLDGREKEMNESQRSLDQQDADVTNREKLAESMQSDLIKKDADIRKREGNVSRRELEAKNKFVKQQREAFHEAIEYQIKQLDSREKELDSLGKQIEDRLRSVIEKEGQNADRERALKERELSAEAGFASKNQVILRELAKREESCKAFEKQLKNRETTIFTKLQTFEQEAEKLRQREEKLRESEIIMQEGFNEQKKDHENELSERRVSFDKEMNELRVKRYSDLESQIEKELAGKSNRCAKDLKEMRDVFNRDKEAEEDRLKSENDKLTKLRAELDTQSEDIEYNKARLKSREGKLIERESNIDDEVDLKIAERQKAFESHEVRLKDECERLRESIRISEETRGNYDELKRKLGNEDPEQVLLRLNEQEEALKRLRSDLLERPTEEMRTAFDKSQAEEQRLKDACTRLSEENNTLRDNAREQNQLEMQIQELTEQNKSLTRRFESVDADNNRLNEDLKRLQASYEREQDREARIRDIETPYFKEYLARSSEQVNEIDWLNRIDTACIDYGLRFPKRILYAFHTALKTAEWSPITVMAGVSGTGKSELPRLYSHFGGLNFLSLAVQPNWDSQESMLGFFNSIDNKFDAQSILRLLAQSQKKMDDNYPGLEDVMCMILLDEMNLAHIELYFAEFLSKLELRRGQKGNDVPSLEVKLGAGLQPYNLPLGRNVLWTGTMNQDETTKSLSDKVLDRGIVIYFPRPTTLERRLKLRPLNDTASLLPRRLWESWWSRESRFTNEQIKPFKGFIEDMNNYLANVGRALGHRVWQSVEYYLANYPTVRKLEVWEGSGKEKRFKEFSNQDKLYKEMKVAFEDQLVQKVMPKLRGIETRGPGRSECLDKIQNQLVNEDYAIVEDFGLAYKFGYGQFMWNSANYLKDNNSETTADMPALHKSNDIIESLLSLDIDSQQAEKLAQAGFTSIEEIKSTHAKDLEKAGLKKAEIASILKKVNGSNA